MTKPTPRTVNDREAREAFHTLVLLHLRQRVPPNQWRVKGGVNLRLFFRSVRYSEDLDLDAEPRAREAMKGTIRQFLADHPTRRRLADLGIRDVLTNNRPAKDTDTTLRFKLRLVIGGAVELPTKVEVSFRGRAPGDTVLEEAADATIVGHYLDRRTLPLVLPHYARSAAVRQKILALAGRPQVQARDVFDLAVLCTPGDFDQNVIAKDLAEATLRGAGARVFELGRDAYESQVLEFLDEPARGANKDKWEESQLIAATLIESLLDARRAAK